MPIIIDRTMIEVLNTIQIQSTNTYFVLLLHMRYTVKKKKKKKKEDS